MWLECIRYRFRLDPDQDCLELAQAAALQSLRHSPRCRSWRVLPSPTDPSLSILEIEWDAGPSQAPFRGSEEFAALHAALTAQVRALDEADGPEARSSRRALGAQGTIFQLAEDIVTRVMRVPELAGRFHSRDGSRRARLGLWLVEVLGGPALFTSSFPAATPGDGPLAGEPLDLDERELFLEVARDGLPRAPSERGSLLGTLRAHLPVYPAPPDAAAGSVLPLDGEELFLGDDLLEEEDLLENEPLEGELLLESELLLEEGPVPRGYLAAPSMDDTASSSGAPAAPADAPAVELQAGDLHTADARLGGAEPPSSEWRATDDASAPEPGSKERDAAATWTRRRLGRRYRAFDSGVFPQARRQTAKR
jgi:hemoglobin